MKRSLIIVACEQEEEKTVIPEGAVNLWWTTPQDGALMLLLAYLLTETNEWRARPLRIIYPVAPKADVASIEQEMAELLSRARIEAEVVVVPTEAPLEAVRRAMGPSAVLLAGFEPPDEGPVAGLTAELRQTVELPGDVVLVYNAGDVSLDA